MQLAPVTPPDWFDLRPVGSGRSRSGTVIHQRGLVVQVERVVQVAPERSGPWPGRGPDVAWAGNDRLVLEGHAVRRLAADGERSILVGSVAVPGYLDFQMDTMPPGTPCLRNPTGLAIADGALYLADTGNRALRRFELATRQLTTVAGDPELEALAWGLLRRQAPARCPRCGNLG